jgi:hypothetical protein
MEITKKDISILPSLFPGSVGLSNPPSTNKQQIPPASPELKRKFSADNILRKPSKPQRTVIETTISSESNAIKPQIFSSTTEIVRKRKESFVPSSLVTPTNVFKTTSN